MQAPSRVLLLGTSSGGVVSGVTSGTSPAINRAGQSELSLYVRGIGTITGGTLLIEEADYGDDEAPYSGTWSQLTSIACSDVTGGAQKGVHLSVGAYGYLRARISSAVTGGGTIAVVMLSDGDD
jgi:hypothetical protein